MWDGLWLWLQGPKLSSKPPQAPQAAIAGTAPLIPFANIPAPFNPSTQPPMDQAAAEQLLAQHRQGTAAAAAAAANVDAAEAPAAAEGTPAAPAVAPPAAGTPEGTPPQYQLQEPSEHGETATKYTGVRRNKGGRFSARIKIAGTNKCAHTCPSLTASPGPSRGGCLTRSRACRYLGSFKTAEDAARAFDAKAVESGRPVETLNFPAAYGGPTVGQAYRKRKVHRLYGDPQNHINVLLQKLGDVDRSNPGILRLTMSTLGVPETRYRVRLAL